MVDVYKFAELNQSHNSDVVKPKISALWEDHIS